MRKARLTPTGYAVSCAELLRALDRNRVRVIYRYAYGPGTPGPDSEPQETGDHLLDVLRARPDPPEPGYTVSYTQGDIFESALKFARCEGTVPAPESAHAVHSAILHALEARESGERTRDQHADAHPAVDHL